jgi:DNA-binding response OmpR family regulator
MRGDNEKAISAGFDGYLTKPIGIAALRAAIEARISRP